LSKKNKYFFKKVNFRKIKMFEYIFMFLSFGLILKKFLEKKNVKLKWLFKKKNLIKNSII